MRIFFIYFLFFTRPKSRTFAPKSTECKWDVDLILRNSVFFLQHPVHGLSHALPEELLGSTLSLPRHVGDAEQHGVHAVRQVRHRQPRQHDGQQSGPRGYGQPELELAPVAGGQVGGQGDQDDVALVEPLGDAC